jgi:hypothetical protein
MAPQQTPSSLERGMCGTRRLQPITVYVVAKDRGSLLEVDRTFETISLPTTRRQGIFVSVPSAITRQQPRRPQRGNAAN